jgi:cation transport regulator ChaB
MPYKYPDNIPEGIKGLPAEAQKTWIDIYNSAFEQYKDRPEREGLANATAWAGLKKAGWKKDKEGNWIKTETQGNLNAMELALLENYSQTYELTIL